MADEGKARFYERLAELGFEANYDGYLLSDHWKAFRRKILKRDRRCRACDGKAEVVHHLTYRRLGRELMEDALALCFDCHSKIHLSHSRKNIPLANFYDALAVINPEKAGDSLLKKPRKRKRKQAGPRQRHRWDGSYIEPLPPVEPSPDAIADHPLFARRRIIAARLSGGASVEGLARELECSRVHLEQIAAWMTANEPSAIAAPPTEPMDGSGEKPRKGRRNRPSKRQTKNPGPFSPVAIRMIARPRNDS